MPEPLIDVDLDALAPAAKRTRLGGKIYRLPGDMPLPLFFRIQAFEQRIEQGTDEAELLAELQGELLALFQVHQPTMKTLPGDLGVLTLMGALGAIYGGGRGEAPPPVKTRPSRKRTPSKPAAKPRRAPTSR